LPHCQEARPSGELSSGARLRGFHRTQAVFFLRHSLREAGYLAKFDFLNDAALKKQLRQHGGIQWAWRSWNTASRSNSAKLANIEI
jgi:hypothetical protein